MSVVDFRSTPVRAIEVRAIAGEDSWQAVYLGDGWTAQFLTPPGPLHLVLATMVRPEHRKGLPIVRSEGYFEVAA